MRKMKKVMAAMLAATMALSMGMTAFAEVDNEGGTTPTETPTYKDIEEIDLQKLYKITNDGTVNPAETFYFTIEKVDVTDSQYTTDNMPMPSFTKGEEDTTGEISFTSGEANKDGDTNSAKLYLPRYDKVGIFTYKITETPGNTAGVAYDSKDMYLKVTVIEQDGLVRVAYLHYESANGTKEKWFENEYSAGDLSVSKSVDGIMGDKTKYFKFTITLTGVTGKSYENAYAVEGGSYEANPKTIAIGTPTEFYLKDTDTITIKNLPYNVTYTVTEDSEDYTPEFTWSDEANKKIDSPLDTVSVKNTKGGTVDTGINLDNAPYILLLVIAALGMFGFVSKKRSSEF